MSEEEYSEEEVEMEEDTVEVSPTVEAPSDAKTDNLTEAEKAMLASKKRTETGEAAKLQDYEQRRRVEREQEEEELRMLKEKQEQRRIQREQEDRQMEERRAEAEERRKAEEEERIARAEAERKRKEEEKKKRQQSMMGVGFSATDGRIFTLPYKNKNKGSAGDKFENIVQAKLEMGMNNAQREEAKKVFIAQVLNNLEELSSLGGSALKAKLKQMHKRICKLETEKYDLEKCVQSQQYNIKELVERTRFLGGKRRKDWRYPPKVMVASKYDRQIDRRHFTERRAMYDKKNAYPCFPNMAPPPTILEFRLLDPTDKDEEEEEE